MTVLNSHKTAIARKTLPVPVRWLLPALRGKILDYGCGKCKAINPPEWDSYDPFYAPNFNTRNRYDYILCTYVLCTLPESEELPIMRHIQKLLKKNGLAYITVRNDVPTNGHGISSRGTLQRKVEFPNLNLFLVRKTSQYRIYELTKKDILG